MSSMVASPYMMDPQAVNACVASPLFRFRPEMMKMPVVVRVCRPASAALIPGLGQRNLRQAGKLEVGRHADWVDVSSSKLTVLRWWKGLGGQRVRVDVQYGA